MADYILAGEVELNTGKASQSVDELSNKPVKNLKQQLREATIEVQRLSDQFGPMSFEAINAAKKAGALKDSIGDATDLIGAFNPDAKFNAFAGALSGVAGGFSAVQGAMGLFGAESKEVEKMMLKVQSAMALSQGLNSVIAARDQFKNLGALIKSTTAFQTLYNTSTTMAIGIQKAFGIAVNTTSTAFKALRGAIVATGIGALVVVMGLLIDKIMSMVDSTEENEAAQKKLNAALEQQNKLYKDSAANIEYENKVNVLRAKIAGKSADDIYNINKESKEKLKALNSQEIEDLRQDIREYESGQKGKVDKTSDYYKSLVKRLGESKTELNKINQDITISELEEQDRKATQLREKDKKASDDRKAANEKKKQQTQQSNKEIEEANKQSAANILKLEQEAELLRIQDDADRQRAKAAQEYKNAQDSIKNSKATEAQKQKELAALKINYDLQSQALEKTLQTDEQNRIAEFEKAKNQVLTDIRLAGIKDANQKETEQVKLNYINQYAEIDKNEKYNAEQKLALKTALKQKEDLELKAIEDKQAKDSFDKQKQELDAVIQNDKSTYQQKVDALAAEEALLQTAKDKKVISEKDYNDQYNALSNARIEIDKKESEAKLENAQRVSGLLSGLSNAIGKETAAGKAFAVASATIDTYVSAQRAYKNAQANPISILGPAYPFIQAGLAVAAGIKNVKEIMKVKTPGGSGGSTPTPSASQMPPAAPIGPQTQSTMLNQGQINQLASANASVKAYVIESDVSNNQQRIQRLNRASRFN
jgi:myosin heavy subunit